MIITKHNNNDLTLQLEASDDNSIDAILNNDDLFMSDLYFETSDDGCLWLVDQNKNTMYRLSIYPVYREHTQELDFFKRVLNYERVDLPYYKYIES